MISFSHPPTHTHTQTHTQTHTDRRYRIISELIDTERKYINSLETLLNMFLPALEHAVSPRDLRLMFPAQLEPLVERHRELLTQLEERTATSSHFAGIVGDIFDRLLVGNVRMCGCVGVCGTGRI